MAPSGAFNPCFRCFLSLHRTLSMGPSDDLNASIGRFHAANRLPGGVADAARGQALTTRRHRIDHDPQRPRPGSRYRHLTIRSNIVGLRTRIALRVCRGSSFPRLRSNDAGRDQDRHRPRKDRVPRQVTDDGQPFSSRSPNGNRWLRGNFAMGLHLQRTRSYTFVIVAISGAAFGIRGKDLRGLSGNESSRHTNHTKPEVEVAIVGEVVAAIGGTRDPRNVDPGPAPHHTNDVSFG